jgi:hypothetical protein
MAYLSPSLHNLQNHVSVLPCGGLPGQPLHNWSPYDLEPYASYLLNGQGIDRMFGGVIFNCINSRDSHFISPLYIGFGKPSNQTDWMKWIDDLFASAQNLQALFLVTNWPLDVWVSIPYPDPSQRRFGLVNGRELDFQKEEDRKQAVAWWIDQFVDRWKKESYLASKLHFRGFLWQKESIDTTDEDLVRHTTAFIRGKGYCSMWLSNYGSYGMVIFQSFGFDITAIHPNYYGNTMYGVEWINFGAQFARNFQTGMQIMFGKGSIYNDTHHLDYLNYGLPEYGGYMTESFLVYQFPNQTLRHIYETQVVDYIRLYTFIKGRYTKVSYPGITY